MADMAKGLTHRIVAPARMGSIPIIRPREWKKSSDIVRLTFFVFSNFFGICFSIF